MFHAVDTSPKSKVRGQLNSVTCYHGWDSMQQPIGWYFPAKKFLESGELKWLKTAKTASLLAVMGPTPWGSWLARAGSKRLAGDAGFRNSCPLSQTWNQGRSRMPRCRPCRR